MDSEKYERTKLTAMIDDIEKENYKHSNLIMDTVDLIDKWERLVTVDEEAGKFLVTINSASKQNIVKNDGFYKSTYFNFFNHAYYSLIYLRFAVGDLLEWRYS